ncbi:MAG: hypothetical protein KY454_01885 [Actinobacteria bacterium]|nr:hypothetical protein [Actinomycetota bacterium]MBW3649073.1 hypothetical protein [Actinomycetota bacterium]
MTPPAWWEGLAEVQAQGPAGAEHHRLVWREGEFFLADHLDPEAELALVALGGERCPCLDLLDAWVAQHEEAAIFTVGARLATEGVELNDRLATARRAEVTRWRSHLTALRSNARRRSDRVALDRLGQVAGPAERAAASRLGLLYVLSLPPILQLRLQASVAATLAARGRLDRLMVPTAVRARPALREMGWLGRPADVELCVEPAAAVIEDDRAVLPCGWLAEVWGRGLGLLDAGLAVAVTAVAENGSILEVLVAAPGKPQVPLTVERWENGWRPI